VDVVFVPDLTGENGPAERFRTDATLDACCVITPDMIGLTGGLDSTGTGAEGTVEGAHVLVSTQNMSRSIADVYAVRADWFQENRETVEKFVAGYLKASAEVVGMRDAFEESQRMTNEYRGLLQMAQGIFGEEVLPTLEVDAHGLLLDCRFARLPGQIAFFQQSGNLNGFEPKLAAALDLAVSWGYAKSRNGFQPPDFDYQRMARLAEVEYVVPETMVGGGPEDTRLFLDDDLDPDTIVSFTIGFKPNQKDFSAVVYAAEFRRALQAASTFGGAAVVIRGHADPTKTLVDLIKSGMKKGIIQRTGQSGNYRYFLRTQQGSQELDLNQTKALLELIESGAFEGTDSSPLQTMQAALNLSLARAEAVKQAIIDYAGQQNISVNLSQLKPVGAGVSEPVISKPSSMAEAMQNMRVEFRIVRVNPEELSESDFDF
jgi:outer membrane protein OmpA-like peptidoglycan-associated protein